MNYADIYSRRPIVTDFRALCTELVEAWDSYSYVDAGDAVDRMDEAVKAARAALAAAPGVEPSDELLSIDDLREAWDAQSDAFNSWDQLGVDEIAWWAQRQALAHWGRYPAPPAEGEDYQERPTAQSVAMTDLSPAAQAVLDAFNREARPEPHHQREAIAAALRAAADQTFPDDRDTETELIRSDLLAIATELEGHHG